ncbi:hypothetical protein P5G50_08895 [Leifsonia sp. F6_8S_P_1B]|uniref:Lipoprotein n=1 Tax=Leifsonia williamsii TaxID=3035919 RepID=A0ABT8KAV5_9MICO|nr:hypothetical protein [Leifsonia williamsii]MDN4614568.1 hypothetical protein [Leifsonia williamsii]
MRRIRSLGVLGAVVVLAAAALAGCAGPAYVSAHVCLPDRLVAEPSAAAPGEVVLISSGGVECNLGYEGDHSYRVTVRQVGASSPAIGVPVQENGTFHAAITVPEAFTAGEAVIVVEGSTYDQCDDSGFGSCAGYSVGITVR